MSTILHCYSSFSKSSAVICGHFLKCGHVNMLKLVGCDILEILTHIKWRTSVDHGYCTVCEYNLCTV